MRWFGYLLGAVAALLLSLWAAIYLTLRGSLPQIEGRLEFDQLTAAARIERDAYGVPSISAQSRRDLAFATGVAHAQDRFFQMDLMRRAAAGELAALLGEGLIEADRSLRLHAFRNVAEQVVDAASESDRQLLDAYAEGVNTTLARMGVRPWEYLLLRAEPQPWLPADSVLVAFSMYLSLNDSTGSEEIARGLLKRELPAELYAFLHPIGTEWDAPIVGGPVRDVETPGPEIVNVRTQRVARVMPHPSQPAGELHEAARLQFLAPRAEGVGSNAWAVASTHAAAGRALLANDMHLPLRLPNVWYHARLRVERSGNERRDLIGITLPGLPALIAGSNGRVAWGYTNSYGDWTDVTAIVPDPANPEAYQWSGGSEPFGVREERIEVHGGKPVTQHVRTTRWGPVVNRDNDGTEYALTWTAHDPRATNLGLMQLEAAQSVEQALDIANRAGGPVQNIVVADASGRIGWSLQGQVPVRGLRDHSVPAVSRSDAGPWSAWQAPEFYPRSVDPLSGRIWSANTRALPPDRWLAFLGDGGYDLGARAAQIRDGLFALNSATATDMLRIQLDDRALFLARWRDLLLEIVDRHADSPQFATAAALVNEWSGKADVDSVAYRIVREFRHQVHDDVFATLTQTVREKHPHVMFEPSSHFEGPLWHLVTQRPMHLLDARFSSWEQGLAASLRTTLDDLVAECGDLRECRWGRTNRLRMRHPLSDAVPLLGAWVDMREAELPGDSAMPRVQRASFGASQRIVVSPGHEEEGIFQMPGGPVDHPLSPFYAAGHDEWVRGEARPLLPGRAEHILELVPGTRRSD